ncbi:MAG: hypothetical protein K2R98_18770 [Gemmataceae bacterium]|nr:hypothetical protein [Gemmataceae bacterium]
MDRVRLAPMNDTSAAMSCCRCEAGEHRWDRIAGRAYCPNCQEAIVLGEADPLAEKAEAHRCVVCARRGTVRFLTFPLNIQGVLELDLCAEHLRGMLSRRLGPHAFHQLQRQLRGVNVATDDIFLLHGEFYDHHGRALRPAVEAE